jgi:putative DNA primase/helicase
LFFGFEARSGKTRPLKKPDPRVACAGLGYLEVLFGDALICIWACPSLQAARGLSQDHAHMTFTNSSRLGRSTITPAEIEHARAVRIEDEIACRGITLRRVGAELIGPCPVCGGNNRFGVNVRKQVFNCRGCTGKGDVIALVRFLDGCTFRHAVTKLIGNGQRRQATPKAPEQSVAQDDKTRAATAAWLWSQRKPITEGTPPSLYLSRRGYTGPIPETLGYLPSRGSYPAAMIGAFGIAVELQPGIISAPPQVIGVHLTRLTAHGDKAPNAEGEAKFMHGLCKGAPIVLSPPNDFLRMTVTEGIEDGLTVYQTTGVGVWAAGSATLMPALAALIPDYIEIVTICAHDDNTGRKNAIVLARAIKARGIEVLVQGL